MTRCQILFYCNDDIVTYYERTVVSNNRIDDDTTGAITYVFDELPTLPKNIVGVICNTFYWH